MQKLLESLPKSRITPDIYKSLPESAGIYVFFTDKTPIYIGKAINLKRRVSSYFDLDLSLKTAKMVGSANFLSYIRVESELESLLLEARLIRTYMPHYNVLAKDDKHPLYIRITKEEYPRVITARKTSENEKNLAFFGPFPSSTNVYSVLRMLRRIFPYSDHKVGKRPCLYSHIGLCNPCPNQIVGIKNEELRIIGTQKYKWNIKNIRSILEGRINTVGKELEKEMKTASDDQNFELASQIRDQIQKLGYITQPQIPTDYFIQNPNLIEETRNRELRDLQIILNLNFPHLKNIHRIECFDIAHLSGTNPTASMVTFVDGETDKTFYRHFKIKKARGGDDYSSMEEVAKRRAKHVGDWGIPDLIIVDGGIGQVKSFATALHITVATIPVIGIAKHPDHLVFEDGNKIQLKGNALNLVQRIRDEAHRFARRYHHHLISREYQNANNT